MYHSDSIVLYSTIFYPILLSHLSLVSCHFLNSCIYLCIKNFCINLYGLKFNCNVSVCVYWLCLPVRGIMIRCLPASLFALTLLIFNILSTSASFLPLTIPWSFLSVVSFVSQLLKTKWKLAFRRERNVNTLYRYWVCKIIRLSSLVRLELWAIDHWNKQYTFCTRKQLIKVLKYSF